MEDRNYRAFSVQKSIDTRNTLNALIEDHPEDQTLKIFAEEIVNRMKFMDEMLQTWYKDGIEDEWDSETIHVGKAACMGSIDSLELLTADIRRRFDNI